MDIQRSLPTAEGSKNLGFKNEAELKTWGEKRNLYIENGLLKKKIGAASLHELVEEKTQVLIGRTKGISQNLQTF